MRSFDKRPDNEQAPVQQNNKKNNMAATGNARQQHMLHLQRTVGNRAVQRQVALGEIDSDTGSDTPAATGAGNSIGDGTATIKAEAGVVDITAAAINLNAAVINANAPLTQHAGIDQSETVVANNVVATNYTPGAGNLY